jgi:hypothetical protein
MRCIAIFMLIGALVACAQPDEERVRHVDERKPVDECPPLPTLAKDASKFELNLWTMTVIALYEQCAKSKR